MGIGRTVSYAAAAALLAACGDTTATETVRSTITTTSSSTPTTSRSTLETDRSQIVAAAVAQVAMIDNTYGGAKVYTVVQVVESFDASTSKPLSASDREVVVDALRGYAEVVFVPDAKSLIGPDLMKAPRGLFIITIGEPTIEGDKAQIRMSMWCGSLCGTARTYGMARQQSAWRVTGTIGSIMVS